MTNKPQPPEQPDIPDEQDDVADMLRQVVSRARAIAGDPTIRANDRRRPKRVRRNVTWHAGERELPGPGPDPRDPQQAGNLMSRFVAERGWKQEVGIAGTLARWEQLVGDRIAANTKVERFADGVLTVRAKSSRWAKELTWSADQVKARLNEDLGEDLVQKVVFLPPLGPTFTRGPLRVKGRGVRDTYDP